MAERGRAYVSDAFARIPPWCNGSTRVFGTFGPGSNPGGGAWRQHVELFFPLHSIRCLLYRTYSGSGVTQAAKRCHALVAQWIERPPPERKATSPILVEGTHETPSTIMSGFSLLFSLTPSRLVRFVHYEGNAL